MNPYKGENAGTIQNIMRTFYNKFYNDEKPRTIILGINPGRFGAGQTGLMFTDTIHLNKDCGIPFTGFHSRELSSEFFYQMISNCGGAEIFYHKFYIGAVSPLGYTIKKTDGKEVNYNYYDSKKLENALLPFIEETLKQQLEFNINRDLCFCLGTGKNFNFLEKLNKQLKLFKQIIPLEHPRYILQYKRKDLQKYIEKYTRILNLQ